MESLTFDVFAGRDLFHSSRSTGERQGEGPSRRELPALALTLSRQRGQSLSPRYLMAAVSLSQG